MTDQRDVERRRPALAVRAEAEARAFVVRFDVPPERLPALGLREAIAKAYTPAKRPRKGKGARKVRRGRKRTPAAPEPAAPAAVSTGHKFGQFNVEGVRVTYWRISDAGHEIDRVLDDSGTVVLRGRGGGRC